MSGGLRWVVAACLFGCVSSSASQLAHPPAPTAEPKGDPAPKPREDGALPSECPEAAGVCLVVDPADAEVVVNGASMGAAGDYAARGGFLALEPGIYQIVLRAPGYRTWRAEVAVKAPAEPLTVRLAKQPEP